jgi:acetoin utilization deacetylase AcuC-like enzyme
MSPTHSLKVISTVKAGQYEISGHPEQPARVLQSLEHLKKNLAPSVFEEPKEASLEKIRAVHGEGLIHLVQADGYFDPDTPGAPGIFTCSLLSAGAALQAAEESLKGTPVFSLMRPPGHHATPQQAMGFCYFNSMAVAIQDMVQQGKAQRIAVLDLDCHHGNGTEDFCLGKEEFLYVSLHQFPAYPGAGRQSRVNCVNYPLAPGTEEGDYFPALESALKKIQAFKPDLIGVSMGFDTYEKDPLTQFGLVKKDYRKIGQWMKALPIPVFSLLEGGYHDDLPFLIEEYLTGWTS